MGAERGRELAETAGDAPGWEDFRLVGAVAEAGSLPAAARRLGISHSTVFRRLGALEARLGATLFERGRDGYAPTPAGEEMAAIAREMEARVAGFAGRMASREILPAGDLRVATSDALLIGLLTPVFAAFRRECPSVRLEVTVGNYPANLSRRDADVAIRATDAPPETLAGRRVGALCWALYGPAGRGGRDWVSPSDDLADLAAGALTRTRMAAEGAAAGYRANSILGLAEAVAQGAGRGFLPCFLGDARPDLVRLEPPAPELTTGLWLLVHPDLQRAPRARAFLDFSAGRLTSMRRFLQGETRAPDATR